MFRLATKLLPEREALSIAYQAGFRAAEYWSDANVLSRADEVISLSREFDMEYVVHFPNRADLSTDLLHNAAQLYDQLGCRAMVIHHPMNERYGTDLLHINDSIRLGVENHRLDVAQFQDWAERNHYLTLDVEHLWKYTLEDAPLDQVLDMVGSFLSCFAAKLVHVHMPGYVPGYDEHRPMYCNRDLVLGVWSLLEEAGFDGFTVSEVNTEFQNSGDLHMDVLLHERWQILRTTMNSDSHV